jgi:hypothetical protein
MGAKTSQSVAAAEDIGEIKAPAEVHSTESKTRDHTKVRYGKFYKARTQAANVVMRGDDEGLRMLKQRIIRRQSTRRRRYA